MSPARSYQAQPDMTFPDPFLAVVQPDPGPAYRALLEARPVRLDRSTGWWVVTGYREAAGALTAPGLRTRPVDEPVPTALMGRPTGDVFSRLVRMTDHPASRAIHHAIQASLASIPTGRLQTVLNGLIPAIVDDERRRGGMDWPVRALFRIPVAVTAALLGLPRSAVDEVTPSVRAFARAIAPAPFDGPVVDGDRAVESLSAQLTACLENPQTEERPGLLHDMARHPALADPGSRDHLIANAIGLLFQSMDATAGLTGNTLGQFSRDPVLRVSAARDPGTLAGVLRETLRYDPPVHSTRRYVASPTRLGDATLAVGDRAVVVLAAANRDPSVWDEPERFDPRRNTAPDPLTFGIGPHRCPGQRLAWEIARAGVEVGLRTGLAEEQFWSPQPRIIPSANVRIPEIVDRYASSIEVDAVPASEETTP